MKIFYIAVMGLLTAAMPFTAFCAEKAHDHSTGIDLNQHYVDPLTGKVVPNDADRKIGVEVMEPIVSGELNYRPGDKVAGDAATPLLAWAEENKRLYAVKALDPNCDQCAPLTLGWILGQAILFHACTTPAPTLHPDKSPACTDAEKKAEADPMQMLGRADFAREIEADEKDQKPLSLTASARDILKYLVAARFASIPIIVAQTWIMIDPDVRPIPFDR